MARIQPEAVEQVAVFDLPKRMKKLRARFVPEKSTGVRQIYWIAKGRGGDGKWVMVTARNGVATLGYYPMERCPCEDN